MPCREMAFSNCVWRLSHGIKAKNPTYMLGMYANLVGKLSYLGQFIKLQVWKFEHVTSPLREEILKPHLTIASHDFYMTKIVTVSLINIFF